MSLILCHGKLTELMLKLFKTEVTYTMSSFTAMKIVRRLLHGSKENDYVTALNQEKCTVVNVFGNVKKRSKEAPTC